MQSKSSRFLLTILIGLVIWFMPMPAGIKPEAWHLLAIFVATIAGCILQPLPIGAMAFIAGTITVLTNTLKIGQVLGGFGTAIIWLIVSACVFAKAMGKTGLGERISYVLMKRFGTSTLKLVYALLIGDMFIAPVMPSNTARSGGIFYPILISLSKTYNSEPGPTAGRIGRYLLNAVFQGDNMITGMYMTGMAANVLMVGFAKEFAGVEITWGGWLFASFVPMFIATLFIPYFIYLIDPPEIKKTPEARDIAQAALDKLGPMTSKEKWLLGILACALILWATTSITKLNATTVALAAISAMLLTGALEWKDVLEEKTGWNTMIWMGVLVGLAGFLNKMGITTWISKMISASLSGFSWPMALFLLVVANVASHYLFASISSHVSALYGPLLVVAIALGAPPYLAAFMLIYSNESMQGLTHYAVGQAPIYFGSNYFTQGEFWKSGLLVAIVSNAIFLTIGAAWMKVAGLW